VTEQAREFVVVSGLPGSGKTTLARELAPLLGLAFLDKDDILELLFDSKGTGDSGWREKLSRESDQIFQAETNASNGAVLVSFWHVPGMGPRSGTPIDWLRGLGGRLLNLHCFCAAEVAAERYLRRKRHPGHLDRKKSYDELLADFLALDRLGPVEIEPRVEVDTGGPFMLDDVAAKVKKSLGRNTTGPDGVQRDK